MLEQLVSWDKTLLLELNGSDSLFFDGLFWTVTQTLTWIPFFLALIYIIYKNNEYRNSILLFMIISLLIVVTDQFSSSFCKPFFHRFRPTHDPDIMYMVDMVNGYRGGWYGFFSSHASNTFGLAFFLVCYSVIGGQRWSCFAGRLYLVIAASILACISLGISWLAYYVVPF